MAKNRIVPCHGLTLRRLGSKYLMVESAGVGTDLAHVYTLNETAACLWEAVCGGRCSTADELADLLCQMYEIEADCARNDVRSMLAEWEQMGLIHPLNP